MINKPVYWKDIFLTEVSIYDISDWKGTLPPSTKDWENIIIFQSIKSLHNALEHNPCYPRDMHNSEQPWIQIILHRIMDTLSVPNDRILEEKIIKKYLSKHGMNQILEIFGLNIDEVMQSLDNMVKTQE